MGLLSIPKLAASAVTITAGNGGFAESAGTPFGRLMSRHGLRRRCALTLLTKNDADPRAGKAGDSEVRLSVAVDVA